MMEDRSYIGGLQRFGRRKTLGRPSHFLLDIAIACQISPILFPRPAEEDEVRDNKPKLEIPYSQLPIASMEQNFYQYL
ncbi:MAG: hypothetical protein ACXV7J_11695 [Methylomonas sp.]